MVPAELIRLVRPQCAHAATSAPQLTEQGLGRSGSLLRSNIGREDRAGRASISCDGPPSYRRWPTFRRPRDLLRVQANSERLPEQNYRAKVCPCGSGENAWERRFLNPRIRGDTPDARFPHRRTHAHDELVRSLGVGCFTLAIALAPHSQWFLHQLLNQCRVLRRAPTSTCGGAMMRDAAQGLRSPSRRLPWPRPCR